MCISPGGELTHDRETGRDDAYAGLDAGPYEDACETVCRVGVSRSNQFDDTDYRYSADAEGKVISKVVIVNRSMSKSLTEVFQGDLQKPEQENPRQRKLLRPIRPQRPNHRHRQAQDHDISNKITDAGANGEGDNVHTSCGLGMLCFKVPEGVYWHALEDVSEEDRDPPGGDDDAGGIDGYSKRTRRREETVVEQE